MKISEQARRMKLDSSKLAATTREQRDGALVAIAEALVAGKEGILAANVLDMEEAKEAGIAAPILKRLKFDDKKLEEVVSGLYELAKLPDPLGKVGFERELDQGLTLVKESCSIGVIGVIFEARPDAMVQISGLCLKSGNCAILKGGSEAMRTNKALFSTIYKAAVEAGMPEAAMFQVEAREEINELLHCHESVDLIIPRGSNSFVRYIMDHSKIPVMGHADGICHVYADKEADIEKAIGVIVDAKTQYVAVCNATETLLVHEEIAPKLLPPLKEALEAKNVEIRGTKEVQDIIACHPAVEEDFATEYLDYIISIKIVKDMEEAIDHINRYGSHHTDSILSEDREAAKRFMMLVDSAGVYHNCSTRFADGFRYGFGAEVGVSTGKLHARGPVGLDGLVTYKYKLFGDGHVVADYAEGRKQFHFKDVR